MPGSAGMPAADTVYVARLVKILDGDTLDMELRVHPKIRVTERLRLLGVDCAERNEDKTAWLAASRYVGQFCADAIAAKGEDAFIVQVTRYDSFGRQLAYVFRVDTGESLADALLKDGHAVERSALMQLREARG